MLRSMTGQGQAQRFGEFGQIAVEIRTVNNRGFKWTPRLSDSLSSLEPRIESLVREEVKRGSILLSCFLQRGDSSSRYQINESVFRSYHRQLQGFRKEIRDEFGVVSEIDLVRIASLPGCIYEALSSEELPDSLIEEVLATVSDALACLNRMRSTEGDAMRRQMLADLESIELSVEEIRKRAPLVVDAYRDRIRGKVEGALRREGLTVEVPDLLREIQIYADRSDISEEITRLLSHGQLFRNAMEAGEPSGRKLDFVIQEMFRETNTIGSKGSDAEIARLVVEMKCALERMRELVQNVE